MPDVSPKDSMMAAWSQLAQDGIQQHRKYMNFLAFSYTKRTLEVDAQEIASMLAGVNAADRTPTVKEG